MAVKGNQKASNSFEKEYFVGFTTVKVVAINPTREELNKLTGKEDSPDDKEIIYTGNDQEGNNRIRLLFCLKDDKNDKLFFYSFNLTDKVRKNKDGDKCQLVNSTCSTTWAPFVKDGDEITDEVNEELIQGWFLNFTDKETKEITGNKIWRKALSGEEELVTLVRSWLGRLNFMDNSTEVLIDTDKLMNQDYDELRELISLDEDGKFGEDGFDTPFVILLGVKTDEDDKTKKYQQIWSKGFLSESFMKYINNGMKFPSTYTQKVWSKFKDEVIGDYGFDGYTELTPLIEYDPAKDAAHTGSKAAEAPTPTSSKY